jgi:peptidoglycan/LPS O-acetylase OafA/YrhL
VLGFLRNPWYLIHFVALAVLIMVTYPAHKTALLIGVAVIVASFVTAYVVLAVLEARAPRRERSSSRRQD